MLQTVENVERQILDEQQKISYDLKDLTIEYYVDKYLKDEENDNNILYVPDYQREFIWDEKRQSRFIESIFLGLPVPFIFVAEIIETGRLEIVDGSQRVRTLAAFIKNQLTLKKLRKLSKLNGYTFEKLKPSRQNLFINTSMKMVVLSSRATPEVRNDMFDRINTSSVPLEPMETRRGVYKGKFTDFVIKCANKDSFLKLLPFINYNKNRRKEEEFALRFFAFAETHPNYKFLGINLENDSLSPFLDKYLEHKNNNFSETEIAAKEKDFDAMVSYVSKLFPNKGFAKKENQKGVSSIYFEAIALGVHFALKEKSNLTVGNTSWCILDKNNPNDFFKILPTRYHTHKASKIRNRIDYVKTQLLK